MDFVVGSLECEGYDARWVVVDRLSKMRHFIPCHTTIDAIGMAKLFLRGIVHLQGLPATIVSDRCPEFASACWGQICRQLGIDRRMSTAFHPQTDGPTERINASMEQHPRLFVNHQQDDWVQWLPRAKLAVNNGTPESTTCTPFFAVQGMDPRMLFGGEPTKEQDHRHLNADQVQARMQQIHEHLWVGMRRSQAVHKEVANWGRIPALNIQLGTQHWLDTPHVQTTRPTQKLNWKKLGQFKVVCRISPYAYELELPASIRIHRIQPISVLGSSGG